MAHTWNHETAQKRINNLLKDVEKVEVVDYSREISLENIPKNKAYRSNSVHLYVDILNLDDMLNVTDTEGEICHKRTLRFLNQHFRAVHRILADCDAFRVDFHNQRLHAVIFKPYDSEENAETTRLKKAVAIAQLIIDVLDETGDEDEHIPNAKVRVGIDAGQTLVVNNGRSGGREPLFLGDPANHAAKLASGGKSSGIYLTNHARGLSGLAKADDPKSTKLSSKEVEDCQTDAALDVSKEKIVEAWKEDHKNNPIGDFKFSAHTPPMRTLDISSLSPANSRRQEVTSIYADIDGFTKYVAANIESNPEDVVRTLHVIRSELDNVLTSDFDGRKVRFIGDCLHGILCEGTAQTTDILETISTSTLCSGALRSSFNLAMDMLLENSIETGELGLAIGFEYGPNATSRLGMQGEKVRCSVSRAVLSAEKEQKRCDGEQTAIGETAYSKANDSVKGLFGSKRIASNVDYNEAVEALSEAEDDSAKEAKAEAFSGLPPAIIKSSSAPIRPHCKG